MPDALSKQLKTLAFLALAFMVPATTVAELSIARGSAVSGSQQRDNAPEWVYTLRQGDTVASITQTLLSQQTTQQQLLEHNGLASNAKLGAGDTLRIPVNWLKRQPEPARVIAVTGNVQQISGMDGRKLPLSEDSIVRVGDEILSGGNH